MKLVVLPSSRIKRLFFLLLLLLSAAIIIVWVRTAKNRTPQRQIISTQENVKSPSYLVIYDDYVTIPGPPRILLWTKIFQSMKEWGEVFYIKEILDKSQCPTWNCEVIDSQNEINDSDVVVFAFTDLKNVKFPRIRKPNQIWVLYTQEAPYSIRLRLKKHHFDAIDDKFNWTITYRRDSTLTNRYGVCKPKAKSDYLNRRLIMNITKSKQHSVAWFVSNCNTPSKRLEYAKELSKFIPVHIYGACGTFKCSRKEEKVCEKMVEAKYKFYLSFESTLCEDYVTEKLFKILRLYTVPIVYGGANYSAIAPPHSYIDAKDYSSPRALADYLKYLENDPTEYMKYFEWKKDYEVTSERMACQLCELLHKPFKRQRYSSIMRWWEAEGICRNPPKHKQERQTQKQG